MGFSECVYDHLDLPAGELPGESLGIVDTWATSQASECQALGVDLVLHPEHALQVVLMHSEFRKLYDHHVGSKESMWK